jgi:hypothetical protein
MTETCAQLARAAAIPVLAFAGCSANRSPVAQAPGSGAVETPMQHPAATRPPDFNQSTGWLGADGASSIDLNDGRVLWLFGDTFVGALKPDGACAEGTKMVNNTIAVQTTGATGETTLFHWGPDHDGAPTAWANSPIDRDAHWMWPAGGGVLVGARETERLVLFFMMMRRPRPADDSVWNFQVHGTATVTVLNPHEPPSAWRTRIAPLRDREADLDASKPVRMLTWGPFAMPDPDQSGRVLVFGVDVSDVGDKRLVLGRAPGASLEDFTTWEFRTGDGWSRRENDAASIATAAVDEFSVSRVRVGGGERLMLTQMAPNLGRDLQVRFADRPEGPWSDAVAVYACPEPAQDSRSFVYSGKAHPEISGQGEMVMTYCVNSTDFWYVVGHVAMYRPRTIRIPWSTLEAAAATVK